MLHHDTEQVPGMFGTLVICLPSQHIGGDVHLFHDNEQQILRTAPTSSFNLTALAWYADIPHEIKAVTSGYRLVLTYNLVRDRTLPIQRDETFDHTALRLTELLRQWQSHHPDRGALFYPLSHLYPGQSLPKPYLKGQDIAKCRYLEQTCTKNGIYCFLANVWPYDECGYYSANDEFESDDEHQDEPNAGEKDEETTDDLDNTGKLKPAFFPHGPWTSRYRPVPQSLHLAYASEDQFLADISDVYDEDATRPVITDGEGWASDLTVAVMMPWKSALAQLGKLRHTHTSLQAIFSQFRDNEYCTTEQSIAAMKMLLTNAAKAMASEDMYDVTVTIFEKGSRPGYHPLRNKPEDIQKRSELARLFETMCDFCHSRGLHDVVAQALRYTVNKILFYKKDINEALIGIVARHVAKNAAEGKNDAWSTWFSVPKLSRLDSLDHWKLVDKDIAILDSIQEVLPASAVPPYADWKRAELDAYLRAPKCDNYLMNFRNFLCIIGHDMYHDTILPEITRTANEHEIFHFLGHFDPISGDSWASPAEVEFLQSVRLQTVKIVVPTLCERLKNDPLVRLGGVEQQDFIRNVKMCWCLGLRDEAATLFQQGLSSISKKPEGPEGWKTLLDFMKDILNLLEPRHDPSVNMGASIFIKNVVPAVATDVISSHPSNVPAFWARHKTCYCKDCAELRDFFRDPGLTHCYFRGSRSFADHLSRTLQPRSSEYTIKISPGRWETEVTVDKGNIEGTVSAWKSHVTACLKRLSELRSDFALELLGGDIVDISGFHDTLQAVYANGDILESSQLDLPVQEQRAEQPAAIRTRKRKRGTIDLTGDDTAA